MRYVIALLLGLATGAALCGLLLYVNPLVDQGGSSLLDGSRGERLELRFDETPAGSIAWITNGETAGASRPPMVQELHAATVEDTTVLVTLLRNLRGDAVGVGVKFTSYAEEPGLLLGNVPAHGVWHGWVLRRGGFVVSQRENHWSYLRNIVATTHLSSGDDWRGDWRGTLTSGPGPGGTGGFYGGSGELAGQSGMAVQRRHAEAWSANNGPVAMQGELGIVIDTTP